MVHPVNEAVVVREMKAFVLAHALDVSRPKATDLALLHTAAMPVLVIPPDRVTDTPKIGLIMVMTSRPFGRINRRASAITASRFGM